MQVAYTYEFGKVRNLKQHCTGISLSAVLGFIRYGAVRCGTRF